jgi:tetratricopeptide (TPR) repeat protein
VRDPRAESDEEPLAAPAPPAPEPAAPAPPAPVPAAPAPPAPVPVVAAAPPPEPPPSAAKPPPARRVSRPLEKLQATARDVRREVRADLLVRAAEDALRAEDFVAAANNFRLALLERNDDAIRRKLESVDVYARDIRSERSLVLAGAAERELRWADAAAHLARAHQVKPSAAVADRAARAHRKSGDLARAADLAAQAVALAPGVVDYRLALAEILVAANDLPRLSEIAAAALEVAPDDPRVQKLAAFVAKKVPPLHRAR